MQNSRCFQGGSPDQADTTALMHFSLARAILPLVASHRTPGVGLLSWIGGAAAHTTHSAIHKHLTLTPWSCACLDIGASANGVLSLHLPQIHSESDCHFAEFEKKTRGPGKGANQNQNDFISDHRTSAIVTNCQSIQDNCIESGRVLRSRVASLVACTVTVPHLRCL